MAYLHGAETIEIDVQGRPITVVLSSVVGFVGIAPKGPVNQLVLVTSPAEAISIFGYEVPGYNLPEAMAAHFAEGGGVCLIVNTATADNLTAVANEAVVVANGRLALAYAPIAGLTIQTGAGVPLVLGVDYSVNAYGNVTITNRNVSGGYPDGTALKASYSRLDTTSVTSTQIIGTSTDAGRTGMACFELAYSTFGFNPKILAVPGYSVLSSVATELQRLAEKYRSCFLLDAPKGSTKNAVLSGRGVVSPLGGFATQSERGLLCYPYVKRADPSVVPTPGNLEPVKLVPLSAVVAGVISATDLNLGFWYSPSNKGFKGVKGLEIALSCAINDSTTDVQQLNANGVMTVFSGFGTGYRTWGNRSASFPLSVAISSFLSVRRTADIIEESIELAFLEDADAPLNLAGIDTIRQKVNTFLSTLVSKGAVIDAVCSFLAEDNPPAVLETGNPVFSYTFLPPPPMERATFKAKLDTSLLRKLVQ